MVELPVGTVTFLFTDIEGSTRLVERLGDAYPSVLTDHAAVLREAFSAGQVVATEGDAFFVVFRSAPTALAAAIEAQQALGRHRWPPGAEVRVRMGIHTGEGRLTGGDYVGLDVHRAARIVAAGHGGQILLSEATRDLVWRDLAEDVALRDLGEHRLKDLRHPERLFQVTAPGLREDFPHYAPSRRGRLCRSSSRASWDGDASSPRRCICWIRRDCSRSPDQGAPARRAWR